MAQANLQVLVRGNVSKSNNNKLRSEGYLLGNISRKGSESVSIAMKNDQFRNIIKQFGRNAVIKLDTDDKQSYSVVVKDTQMSLKDYQYSHIDFQQVSLTEEVKMDVGIKFVGTEFLEAKRLLLNRQMDVITVTGFPQDIPDVIEVDLSKISVGDAIYISDIQFPKGITPEADGTHMVVSVSEVKIQAEEATEAEAEAEAEVEA